MANPHLFVDDNHHYISAPEGMRGLYSTSGIKTATTGAGTAEVDISALHSAADNINGSMVVRIANIGTNPALYAFGAASSSGSFTGNTNMAAMAPNSVEYRRVASTEVSFYHQQVTGANTIQVMALT